MGELSKRGFSISKGKVEDFLKKNCIALKQENSKGRASGKSIYKIIN